MAKIVILHLSDLHINSDKDIRVINVNKIVDVLNAVPFFSNIIIIVSGDIAYSGMREQYNIAFKMFGTIISMIKRNYSGIKVDFMIVPGNHDVNLSTDKGALEIEKILNAGLGESAIERELEKQENYYNYAKGNYCVYVKNPLCCIKNREYEDVSMKIFLFNTALFSTLDNDKGLHYLPMKLLNQIKEIENADINIAVMHHSQHWFHEKVKHHLEELLLKKCQIVFYGHEHNIGTKVIHKEGYNVIFLAGGELCNKGDWNNSEFYMDILDTQENTISVNKYRWNVGRQFYECKSENTYSLNNDKRNSEFIYDKDFLIYLKKDKFNSISEDVSDYYIFQGVEELKSYSTVEPKTFNEPDEFVNEILEKKRIVILGSEDAGKTVLLKQLFLRLNIEQYCSLFCDVSELTNISIKKFLKTIFRQNYEDNDGEFDQFMQLPKSQKAIFLDNIQDMDESQFFSLLKWLDDQFDIIVYSTKKVVELDPVERLKQNAELTMYAQYKIMPFYLSKRDKLIGKIVELKEEGSAEEKRELVERISASLKMLRKMYSMNPYFIIQYTVYYCNNFKDTFATDGDVFSKVFESNLIYAIRPYAKGITVDKILVLLDEVAYWCYKNRSNTIDQKNVSDIIFGYNEKHGDDVDYVDFITICVKAKILQKMSIGGQYRFPDRNRLAYFVARQIIRLWNDNLDDTDLKELIQFVKYGINASVILFITYLTDNMYLIRNIIDKTFEYTCEWKSFDPVNVNIPYLAQMAGNIELQAPNEKDKHNDEEKEYKQEKQEIAEFENSHMIVKDYFDYDTCDSEEELNQIIRSMSLLDIVAKCMPGFEHRMDKKDKDKIIELVYNMPGQIFMRWANLVEKEKEDLLEYLLNEYRNVYLAPREWDSVKKDDMLLYLQIESISLLLELMNMAMNGAVKEYTFKYFRSEKLQNVLHKIQYFMALVKLDKVDEIIEFLDIIEEETSKVIPNYMKRRVLKNYLIKSKKITASKLQQLQGKYFPPNRYSNEYRKILIGRERYKKKQ